MTSMASRYFQGLVIETNEPCYISWDTESYCSKIQRLIELKPEEPNLSTDHQCHEALDEALSPSVCFTGFSSFYLLCFRLLIYTHTHTKMHRPESCCYFRSSNIKQTHQYNTTHITLDYMNPQCYQMCEQIVEKLKPNLKEKNEMQNC